MAYGLFDVFSYAGTRGSSVKNSKIFYVGSESIETISFPKLLHVLSNEEYSISLYWVTPLILVILSFIDQNNDKPKQNM